LLIAHNINGNSLVKGKAKILPFLPEFIESMGRRLTQILRIYKNYPTKSVSQLFVDVIIHKGEAESIRAGALSALMIIHKNQNLNNLCKFDNGS